MNTPITNNEEAKKFICDLYFDGNLYHLDEPASNIINLKTGKDYFTPEECSLLDTRVDEVFKYMEIDPHQLCCSLNDLEI